MSMSLKLVRIGEGVGLVLPEEVLARLHVGEGDLVYLVETDSGWRLTPACSELAEQLKLGREFVERYAETFHKLAE